MSTDPLIALKRTRDTLRKLQPALNVLAREVIDDIIAREIEPALSPAQEVDETERAQVIERLRIMATQRTSTQMDEDEQEAADWQGAYDWFCDESRAIYAALSEARR